MSIIAYALVSALWMAFAMGCEILWPLILGFALSGIVQAVVTKSEMSQLLAGALAAWVPKEFWQAFFLSADPVGSKIVGPLIGPIVAIVSFVCSVGNVPLAAVLWNGGISFGGHPEQHRRDLQSVIAPVNVEDRQHDQVGEQECDDAELARAADKRQSSRFDRAVHPPPAGHGPAPSRP